MVVGVVAPMGVMLLVAEVRVVLELEPACPLLLEQRTQLLLVLPALVLLLVISMGQRVQILYLAPSPPLAEVLADKLKQQAVLVVLAVEVVVMQVVAAQVILHRLAHHRATMVQLDLVIKLHLQLAEVVVELVLQVRLELQVVVVMVEQVQHLQFLAHQYSMLAAVAAQLILMEPLD